MGLRGVPGFAVRVSPEILWIAPAVNMVLFLLLGLFVALLLALTRKRLPLAWQIGLFTTFAIFCWFLLIGKIHQVAALALSLGIATQVGRKIRGKEQQTLAFIRRASRLMIVLAIASALTGLFWERAREHYLASSLPAAKQQTPNVLLISLDTLRADHLSSYGYERATDSNIARLAREGVLFENAIANSSWTLPSHASMFTGRLPHEHKADWDTPLDSKYETLAERLAARGYVTGAFVANLSYATPEWGMDQGFVRYKSHGSSLLEDATSTVYGKKLALTLLPRAGYFDIPGRKPAAQLNREFFDWLDHSSGRPFFGFLNYFDLHDPYLTIDPYRSRFAAKPTAGDVINFQFQSMSFRRSPTVSADEIRSEVDSYDGCLAYLDSQLGELLSELQRRGLDRNTLVVITGDHGEAFGEHDLFGHGNSLYLETLKVPLIIFWPGRVPAGRRIPQIVGLRNIPRTVMELIGDESTSFPGDSLSTLWSENASSNSNDVISELSPGRFRNGPSHYPVAHGGLKSFITEQWHLIVSDSGRTELYDWRRDVNEQNNLAETPSGRQIVDELKQRLSSGLSARAD